MVIGIFVDDLSVYLTAYMQLCKKLQGTDWHSWANPLSFVSAQEESCHPSYPVLLRPSSPTYLNPDSSVWSQRQRVVDTPEEWGECLYVHAEWCASEGMFLVFDDREADKKHGQGAGVANTKREPDALQKADGKHSKSPGTQCQFISHRFCIKCVFITLCPASALRDQLINIRPSAFQQKLKKKEE